MKKLTDVFFDLLSIGYFVYWIFISFLGLGMQFTLFAIKVTPMFILGCRPPISKDVSASCRAEIVMIDWPLLNFNFGHFVARPIHAISITWIFILAIDAKLAMDILTWISILTIFGAIADLILSPLSKWVSEQKQYFFQDNEDILPCGVDKK